MNISICIQNLGKYNEGELIFEWIQLPTKQEELMKLLTRIGINKFYEEYFIADYESPFEIGEYENIFTLNELAEELLDVDENILIGILDTGYDLKDAIIKYKNGDYDYLEGDTEIELAQNFIDEIYGDVSNMDNITLSRYFDYEAFGRDLEFDYTKFDKGYIRVI